MRNAVRFSSAMLAVIAAAQISAQDRVTLSYLGTAGWEISDGRTVVLIDPYLSRLKLVTPNDAVLEDDPRPLIAFDDVARSDEGVVDAHIQRADYILVTHTHLDHSLDVPYIAKKTGALVIATVNTVNFARVSGVPNKQLLAVKGGEDLQVASVSVRVVPSLHGILRRAHNMSASPPPSTEFPADARTPVRIGDLRVEGGTLAYFVRIGGRQILAFGSMNYVEREVDGLRPDVALIGAMPERREIYEYTPRLLRLLGYPRLVLPTHWDRFNVSYDASQAPARQRLQSFIDEVKAASPNTRVIVPEYFRPIDVTGGG